MSSVVVHKSISRYQEWWLLYKRTPSAVLGLAVLAMILLVAIFARWIAPYDPIIQHSDAILVPPSWHDTGIPTFLLGTDDLSRDLLSRLLYGAQYSLGLGCLVVLLAGLMGLAIGLLTATLHTMFANLILRTIDVILALPSLLIAILIVAILGPGLKNAVFAVTLVVLPTFARVTYDTIKDQLEQEYVLAARLDGANDFQLFRYSLLPNIAAPLAIEATLSLSTAILDIAALSFLGLGAQAPLPEWGSILSESREYIQIAPWTVTFPGLAILITVFAINLVGEGLRNAFQTRSS